MKKLRTALLIALLLLCLSGRMAFAAYIFDSKTGQWVHVDDAEPAPPRETPSPSIQNFPEPGDTNAYPSLAPGDKGEDVKRLQNRLTELNFLTGKADGKYGKNTADAVACFQAAVFIDETGIADGDTQGYLFSKDAPVLFKLTKGNRYDERYFLDTSVQKLNGLSFTFEDLVFTFDSLSILPVAKAPAWEYPTPTWEYAVFFDYSVENTGDGERSYSFPYGSGGDGTAKVIVPGRDVDLIMGGNDVLLAGYRSQDECVRSATLKSGEVLKGLSMCYIPGFYEDQTFYKGERVQFQIYAQIDGKRCYSMEIPFISYIYQ